MLYFPGKIYQSPNLLLLKYQELTVVIHTRKNFKTFLTISIRHCITTVFKLTGKKLNKKSLLSVVYFNINLLEHSFALKGIIYV